MSKSNLTLNLENFNHLDNVLQIRNENFIQDDLINQNMLLKKTKRPDVSSSDEAAKEKGIFNNGRWNNKEHRAFIEGIFKFSNDWKRITDDIKTRNCPQARSHSQKFFSKLNKFITKSNSNYYVDLKKIFIYGKETEGNKKANIVEMLFLAHDHLDNVLNCEMLNHNLLSDFLSIVKKNKIPKEKNLNKINMINEIKIDFDGNQKENFSNNNNIKESDKIKNNNLKEDLNYKNYSNNRNFICNTNRNITSHEINREIFSHENEDISQRNSLKKTSTKSDSEIQKRDFIDYNQANENVNFLNLTTIKDNSSEEYKKRSFNRNEDKNKNEAIFTETNIDFIGIQIFLKKIFYFLIKKF